MEHLLEKSGPILLPNPKMKGLMPGLQFSGRSRERLTANLVFPDGHVPNPNPTQAMVQYDGRYLGSIEQLLEEENTRQREALAAQTGQDQRAVDKAQKALDNAGRALGGGQPVQGGGVGKGLCGGCGCGCG